MANVKITDLSAHTNPAATDVLPIVDVGADVTKKVSIQDLLENAGSGTAAAPGIAFDGDSNTGIYRPGADQLAFATNGTERARIDSSGRLLVGTTIAGSARNIYGGLELEQAQVGYNAWAHFTQYGNNYSDRGARLYLNYTTGASTGSATAVTTEDELGAIHFRGANGTTFQTAAEIKGETDTGTISGTSMPGRLVFSVTADGASSPTEAMRIKNSRIINIANTPTYADNAAAKTGGLVDGDVYRTSTGDLKIVYT